MGTPLSSPAWQSARSAPPVIALVRAHVRIEGQLVVPCKALKFDLEPVIHRSPVQSMASGMVFMKNIPTRSGQRGIRTLAESGLGPAAVHGHAGEHGLNRVTTVVVGREQSLNQPQGARNGRCHVAPAVRVTGTGCVWARTQTLTSSPSSQTPCPIAGLRISNTEFRMGVYYTHMTPYVRTDLTC